MGKRYKVDSLIPAAVRTPSSGTEAGAQQTPARRPSRSLPVFESLKRRVASCLPFCGTPGGAEAPEQTSLRPRAPLPPSGPGPDLPASPQVPVRMERQTARRLPANEPPPEPSSSRVPLPLPGEGPAPFAPRRAPHQLMWPDGHQSTGTVRHTAEGPVFEVASGWSDAVLEQRGQDKPAKSCNAVPASLPVMAAPGDPAGRLFVPQLPAVLTGGDFGRDGSLRINQTYHEVYQGFARGNDDRVTPRHLEALGRQDLGSLVKVAGARRNTGGLGDRHEVALKQLFGRSLEAVAAKCQSPQAIENVAQALLMDDSALYLHTDRPSASGSHWGKATASFDHRTFERRLAILEPGQHWYIRTVLAGEEGAHGMGVNIQKQPDGKVRVSVINSHGWGSIPHHGNGVVPAAFKTVSMEEAVSAMGKLLSEPLPPPVAMSDEHWTAVDKGIPLEEWLNGMDRHESRPSARFHGPGQPLVSTRQKASDCVIESMFAFMASALPPADYKIAKAACLNTLVQIADRLEPPGTASADPDLQAARRRLQERITTSLSGYMVAPAGPQAQGG